jgi:hypothetical protein
LDLWCPVQKASFTDPRFDAGAGDEAGFACPLCGGSHPMVAPPPTEVVDPAVPRFRLYPVGAIGLATFLGTPAAGGILLALNFRRLGRPTAAVHAVLWPLLATVGLLAAAFAAPEGSGRFLGLLGIVGMVLLARATQGEAIHEHERAGGKVGGWGRAVLVGLGSLAVVGMVLLIVVFFTPPLPGTRTEFHDGDELYYSEEATKADANRLAAILTDAAYLGDDGRVVTVGLAIRNGRATVGLYYSDGWNDPEVVAYLKDLAERIADGGFGRPVHILVHDLEDNHVRTVVAD